MALAHSRHRKKALLGIHSTYWTAFLFFEYLLRAGIIVSTGETALNETGSLLEGPNFLEKMSSDVVNKDERQGLQSS